MLGLFKGDGMKGDRDIEILSKTSPGMCGGTDAYRDKKAPKTIKSEKMVLFDVSCSFTTLVLPENVEGEIVRYFSAYAVPSEKGSFVVLVTRKDHWSPSVKSWALLENDIFPDLVELVKECDLCRNNGVHHTTHGLPENFGGSVHIEYASGETISFSNNQTPILAFETGQKIVELFREAMQGKRVQFPDVSGLKEIVFYEERKDKGFTEARLAFNPDGTGTNRKRSKYENTGIFESEKPVDADTMAAIRGNIESSGILAWEGMPKHEYPWMADARMTFVFENGESVTVDKDTNVPGFISNGFFNIELEMTTKH